VSHTNLFDRPIIDGHVHVASTRFVPEGFIRDVASAINIKMHAYGERAGSHLAEAIIAQHQDHNADGLVEAMDQAGIAKAALLVPDFSKAIPSEFDPDQAARAHHEIRQRHPGRFFIFGGIDPRYGREGVLLFEKWVAEYGFDGMKLYPPAGYSPSDRALDPFYAICAERKLPVLLHTGPTIQSLDFRFAAPALIDEAARRFPSVNFILAHGAVSNVAECADLCAYRNNVYMDTGGFATALHPQGWHANMAHVLRLGIVHKIIFGSDWPTSRLVGGLRNLVDEVRSHPDILTPLTQRERAMFFGENLLRLFSGRNASSQAIAA
jgi:predicted TIM-barrel fold metal-dependent hydrolase